jgi:hypothetical protein
MSTADQINLAIATATVLSVIVSLAVAIVSFKAVQASRASVTVMREQLEATTRPYILVAPVVRPMSTFLQLRIANTGTSSARNLRLSLDKDYYFNAEQAGSGNLRTYSAFVHPIQEFPPEAELLFHLGVGHRIFHSDLSPLRFIVMATYDYAGKTVEENTTVDLQPYMNAGKPIEPIAERLEAIAAELSHLRQALQRE